MENERFERILLATDGTDSATAAAQVAADLAHASAAEVRVVHAWNLDVHHRNGVWDVETWREAEDLLAETVRDLRAMGVDADGEVVRASQDHIASALIECARGFEADLVVVGSRGLSDVQSLFRHSVGHRLLAALDCPVLVVRGPSIPAGREARKVLLAVAGGDDVAPAARAAIAAASAPGSQVLVLHVAQAIFGAQGFAYVEPPEEIQETMRLATEILQRAGIRNEAMVASAGHVADVVAEAASRWGADMIVIGSSRMGDIGSILFGSVAHQLLRATSRPVLVAERSR